MYSQTYANAKDIYIYIYIYIYIFYIFINIYINIVSCAIVKW